MSQVRLLDLFGSEAYLIPVYDMPDSREVERERGDAVFSISDVRSCEACETWWQYTAT